MKLLPYEHIDYETKLALEEIQNRLAADIEPPKLLRSFLSAHKKYEGYSYGNRFEISRIISYSNSFLPNITGTIEDKGVTRIVNVKMELSPFVRLFLCVLLVAFLVATTAILVDQMASRKFDGRILTLLFFSLFGYGLVMFGFTYEAAKAKAYFDQLFAA
jgi:hypothetical protein